MFRFLKFLTQSPDGLLHTDALFQNMSTVQSNQQPSAPTLASAATIAPVTMNTIITGTAQVATITPPVTGDHLLFLTFTNASPGAFLTTGNIQVAYTPVVNRPIGMLWVAALNKYFPLAVV